MSLLIRGGTIVTATDTYTGDVYVEGETIHSIGTSLDVEADRKDADLDRAPGEGRQESVEQVEGRRRRGLAGLIGLNGPRDDPEADVGDVDDALLVQACLGSCGGGDVGALEDEAGLDVLHVALVDAIGTGGGNQDVAVVFQDGQPLGHVFGIGIARHPAMVDDPVPHRRTLSARWAPSSLFPPFVRARSPGRDPDRACASRWTWVPDPGHLPDSFLPARSVFPFETHSDRSCPFPVWRTFPTL